MPFFIAAHLLISTATVGINTWGTVLLYRVGTICDNLPDSWSPGNTFVALVWMTWVILILLFLATLIPLQLAPGQDAGYGAWRIRWAFIGWVCCCRRCAEVHCCPAQLRACCVRVQGCHLVGSQTWCDAALMCIHGIGQRVSSIAVTRALLRKARAKTL